MRRSACRRGANSDDDDGDADVRQALSGKIKFSQRATGTHAESFSELLVDEVFRDHERSQVINIGSAKVIGVK